MFPVRAIGPALLCERAAVGIATMDDNARVAFARLLRIARSNAGQSRVASFILAC